MASRSLARALFFILPLAFLGEAAGEIPAPVCPALLPAESAFHPDLLFAPDAEGIESEAYFADEVWAKVGERTCLNCHSAGGDAEESKFLLRDPSLAPENLQHNRHAFERMATLKKDGKSRLPVQVSGGRNPGRCTALQPGPAR